MWYKNVGTRFFRFVTIDAFDRQTDGQTAFSWLDRVACKNSLIRWSLGCVCYTETYLADTDNIVPFENTTPVDKK